MALGWVMVINERLMNHVYIRNILCTNRIYKREEFIIPMNKRFREQRYTNWASIGTNAF
jgi:hypothetical protein